MNREKAKDFFSSYAEGALEPGLRNTFEQRLSGDHDLQREFNSFRRTVDELDCLRNENIRVPADLHERIAARLDKHRWEQKRAAAPVWTAWLRPVAIGGIAAVAIVGAVMSILRPGSGAATAQIIGYTANLLQAAPVEDGVQVRYMPSAQQTITITSGGETLRLDQLKSDQRWETVLENEQPHAALFRVTASKDEHPLEIVVPGRNGTRSKAGEGSMEDLAKALAETYNVPVILSGRNLIQAVHWKFEGSDVTEAAGNALAGRGFTVEVKRGNAIWITANE